MRAVVQYALEEGAVELREVAVPDIDDDQVLLRVEAVGVCGSDVHQYYNNQSWEVRIPVTLGHEFCGTIEQIGSRVSGFAVGDLVTSETAAEIDFDSPLTRAAMYNLDPARRGFGYDRDGAMCGYVNVPARLLHRVPEGVPVEIAALTEPCAVAYQAVVVNSRIRPGDVVVVIGPGPIGLLCATLARLAGAGEVVLAGTTRDLARIEIGLKAGATRGIDVIEEDAIALIGGLGDGYGADVVIDAAGVSQSLKTALALVRPAGQVTKVGWGPEPLGYSVDTLVRKGVTLQGSFSHTWGVWERVLRMLGSGQLDPTPYLNKVAELSEWKTCFDGMHDGVLIKAVLVP